MKLNRSGGSIHRLYRPGGSIDSIDPVDTTQGRDPFTVPYNRRHGSISSCTWSRPEHTGTVPSDLLEKIDDSGLARYRHILAYERRRMGYCTAPNDTLLTPDETSQPSGGAEMSVIQR